MSVANSSLSGFKAPNSIINGKRSMLDRQGFDIPLSYYYKSLFRSPDSTTTCVIKVPQILQTYVSGDKQVNIRYVQVLDENVYTTITQPVTRLQQILRLSVMKQNNNFDKSGQQSRVIGYLTYDQHTGYFRGECQLFEMDSKEDIQIYFEWYDTITAKDWIPYKNATYIYMDVEVQYDYNQNN